MGVMVMCQHTFGHIVCIYTHIPKIYMLFWGNLVCLVPLCNPFAVCTYVTSMWVHISRCLHVRNADVNPAGRFCALCQLALKQSVWILYMSLTSAAQCARAVSLLSCSLPFLFFFHFTLFALILLGLSLPVFISAFFSLIPL